MPRRSATSSSSANDSFNSPFLRLLRARAVSPSKPLHPNRIASPSSSQRPLSPNPNLNPHSPLSRQLVGLSNPVLSLRRSVRHHCPYRPFLYRQLLRVIQIWTSLRPHFSNLRHPKRPVGKPSNMPNSAPLAIQATATRVDTLAVSSQSQ